MRIFDHPIHPALVHFPVAFWSLASVLDGLAWTGVTQHTVLAWYCHILGSVMAVPVILTGWLEFTKLEEQVVAPATRHMMFMCSAWIFYLVALFSRTTHFVPVPNPSAISYSFSLCGFLLLMLGGWQGGELVYRYGAGKMVDANRNKTSSLD